MRVVIDTNVLVSALLKPLGKPAAILSLVLEEKVNICFDSRIIAEYINVLKRPTFGFPAKEIADLIEFFKDTGTLCVSGAENVESTHAGDMLFAQVCLAINPDYLVTGNTAHYPKCIGRTLVVNPSVFLEKFYSGKLS